MNDIECLLIVDACRTLIHRYAYFNDARDFNALVELFIEDAVLYRPSTADEAIVGRATILQSLTARPAGTMTFHVCIDVLIEVDSPPRARARSRILPLSGTRSEDGNHPEPATLKPLLAGTFRNALVLTTSGGDFRDASGACGLAD